MWLNTGNPLLDYVGSIALYVIVVHAALFFWFIVLLGEDIKLTRLLVRFIHSLIGHEAYTVHYEDHSESACACGWTRRIKNAKAKTKASHSRK